jgi:cardiolipin synthase
MTSMVTLHGLAAACSVLIYVATTRVRNQRRTPGTAIAWVLALVFVPYLALPLYLLFGSRAARPPARPVLWRAGGDWLDECADGLGLPPRRIGRVTVHADASASMTSLLATIASARSSLDVCVFIFAGDHTGGELADRLIARARDGVRVRVVVDGVGLLLKDRSAVKALRGNGVDVRVFSAPALASISSVDTRNHRKYVIADCSRAWMGGRNFADEYFDKAGSASWRDLTFDCDGPVVADIEAQFEQEWGGARIHGDAPPPPCDPQPFNAAAGLRFVASGLDQHDDTLRSLLISAAYRAESEFLVITPYFVPDAGLLEALRLACARGVAVRIAIPAQSNHQLADFVRGRALRRLAAAGANIGLYRGMNHAKLVVVDRSLAFAGSANFDTRSLLINYEAMIAFSADEDVQQFRAWADGVLACCDPFLAGHVPLWRDMAEGLLLAMAFET